jgi:hypothetical protein
MEPSGGANIRAVAKSGNLPTRDIYIYIYIERERERERERDYLYASPDMEG